MIELNNATKQYDSFTAVDEVSFSVRTGEYFALLGPNGAGKTTIVKMLLDFTRPTSGSLSLNGIPSTKAASRNAVGYLSETSTFHPTLQDGSTCNAVRNYWISADMMPWINASASSSLSAWKAGNIPRPNTYSKGMIQRFGLGAALIGNPKLLILDEPTEGLDPIGIREIRQLLESLKGQGMTIFLNSHLLSEVEKICDTAAIINRGKLLVKDTISAIVKDGDTLEDVFVRLVKG